jgi:photosystem II stability/assembly factor-like uncharacterized protein
MRGSRLTILVIICVGALLPLRSAHAGDGVWTTLDTTPFRPTELAIDPDSPGNVYAVGPQLTLVSRDGGGEWGLADDVPPGTGLLVFDPLTPAMVYALVGGQLQQRIGAEPWKTLAPGLLKGITSFAINPDNPNQLWVATAFDLLRSEDGGNSWTRNALTTSGNITALALGVPDARHVYVAVDGPALSYSADGGASWSRAGAGLEDAGRIYALQADGLAAGTLYLAADGGLYRSTDHGANWAPLNAPQPLYRSAILLWTGAGGGTLYTAAGDVLYRSVDRGATWKAVQPAPGLDITRLVAEPGNPTIMYAIAGGAVLKSFDAGAGWTPPPAESGYILVAAHPTTRGLLLANHVRGGAWRSTDGGRTWAAIEQGWPAGQSIGAFHMHAGDPNRMFAAAGNALLISRDAGQSWTTTGMPTAGSPLAITTAPGDPTYIWVATGRAVLHSSDGGVFWTLSLLPAEVQVNALWVAPDDASQVLAATTSGLYRSNDAGATWLPVTGIAPADARSLWSGAQPGEVYAQSEGGLVFSRDSGATWSSLATATSPNGLSGVVFRDWSDPTVLWSRTGGLLLISPNGGRDWLPVGGPLAFAPSSFVADGLVPRHLYADDARGHYLWRYALQVIPPAPTPTPTPPPTATPTVTPTRKPVDRVPTPTPQAGKADDDPLNWFVSVLLALAAVAALVLGLIWLLRSRSR